MLKLNQVSKRFVNHYQPILNKISLTFKPGEFCVVLGSNGSGKSTLLKTISAEHSADEGTLELNGSPIGKMQREIACVTQDMQAGTVAELSVFENILLGTLKKKSSRLLPYYRHRQRILAILKGIHVDLRAYVDTPIGQLSGGQRQLIATMTAINANPQVLLLDEHTSALDPRMQKIVMEYTKHAVQHSKIITLMVTHQLSDALRYGNRLIILKNGRVVLDASDEKKQSLTLACLESYYHQN